MKLLHNKNPPVLGFTLVRLGDSEVTHSGTVQQFDALAPAR